MLKKKKENKNKRNLAIGATGLAATGLGAAYLLSRKKPTKSTLSNIAEKVGKKTNTTNNLAPKTLGNTENLISKNIDKSPVDIGVEKATGLKKKTTSIWDKVAEKIDNLPSVKRRRRGQQALPGSKPPKGLLRAGYDTPNVDWDSPVERTPLQDIGEKIRTKRQGILTGAPTPKALPMKRISANVAVKGYQRKDGTFVSGYRKNIQKVLREKRLAEITEGLTQESSSRITRSTRPQRLFNANLPKTRQTIDEQVRAKTRQILDNKIDDVQAQTYTRPTLVESGEIITDPNVTQSAKQELQNKYKNASLRREKVDTLTRQADTLAKELEEKAQQKFNAQKQNFIDRVNELDKKIKSYEPNLFEKSLSTDRLDLQINELRTNLDKTLNDPFAPDYFSDSKQRIESLKKELADEIRKVDAENSKPQEFLNAVEKMYEEIEGLKKEYRKVLEDTYAANQDRVDVLRAQLQQENAILQNLTSSDITEDFLRKERESFLREINKRSNRQFFGRTSNVERSLNNIRSRVYNQRTTIRNKIRQQTSDNKFAEYRAALTSLQTSANALPKTRRNLTRDQRTLLRQTENFPKTYKKLYGKLIGDIDNLHAYEKDFMSRYQAVVNDIDSNVNDVFSNKTFNEYLDEVSASAEKVEMSHARFRENVKVVNKVYDPNEVITRYVDLVNRVKDTTDVDLTRSIVPFSKETPNVTLNTIAQRKKVVMQGGYIDGQKYDGLLKDLNLTSDKNVVKSGLVNGAGEAYITMKRSVVDYNDARLAQLADEYITRKKQLLKNIDNSMAKISEDIDYETWLNNPDMGVVLNKINENVRKYNDDFGTNDIASSFFKQKTLVDDARSHLQEIRRVKPEFTIENDTIKLTGIKTTDVKIDELNKSLVEKINLDYARVYGKTRSKRTTIANLYYNLDKAGIQVEGDNNFFKRLRGGVEDLTENEKSFFNNLTPNEQVILQNFTTYGLDEQFQKYYYTNALSYALRGNVKNPVMTQDVSRQLGLTTPDILNRVNDYLGRNKPVDLQKRKLREVQSVVRDLRSLGEDVRLTPFMEVDGEKIPFQNGLMGVTGLPAVLPGEQYRNRNFLVRKLQKLLGVRENGTPLYNAKLATLLSGAEVKDRESLKRLLSDIQSRYYGESDLNTFYMATQLNSEFLRSYDSALYVYNFSEQYQTLAAFSD